MVPNVLITVKNELENMYKGVSHGAIQDNFSANSVNVEMVPVEIRTAYI